ncbi:MAG TPA: BBE domain-containing protein [Candidatus Limnocylindria bacterium]|nr:BBE domain-containing protein [Candidatus Limnocylindria bacterium]
MAAWSRTAVPSATSPMMTPPSAIAARWVEWGGAITWLHAAEDEERIAAARAYGRAMEPFATGVYVNTLVDEGEAGVRRAYNDAKLARLAQLKRRYDPDNVFHLNANIAPASPST